MENCNYKLLLSIDRCDSYFDLLPSELNDLIIIYSTFLYNILDLWESNLFNKRLIDKYLWTKIFEYNSFPIFNRDLYYFFHDDKIANKKFSNYSKDKLFYIITTEFISMTSVATSYRNIINKNFEMNISFDHIYNMTIIYDNIVNEIDSLFIDAKSTIPLSSRLSMQKSLHTLHIKKNIEIKYYIKYLNNLTPIKVKDSKKFLRDLLFHVLYYRIDIDIDFH